MNKPTYGGLLTTFISAVYQAGRHADSRDDHDYAIMYDDAARKARDTAKILATRCRAQEMREAWLHQEILWQLRLDGGL